MRVYHYCVARYIQSEYGALSIQYLDGIFSSNDDFTVGENYRKIRNYTANKLEIDPDNVVILSLSFLYDKE